MASVATLRSEIEKIKQNLSHTDDTIKRITGRENRPTFSNRSISYGEDSYRGKGDINPRFNGPQRDGLNRKRLSSGLMAGPPRQRRFNSSSNQYNRDSADEEDDHSINMTLASSVIATNKDNHSRDEVIKQQNRDREGSARNRRMFGLLMGTLQQFKVDERKNEEQERKRKEVEKKLEEKQKEEKVKMRMEKEKLFVAKKQQQIKLRKLELKMEIVELHEIWEGQSKQLTHFIRTDTKPNIYYLPKLHTEASLKKLESSRKLIEAIVTKRRNILTEDINKVLNTDHFDDMDDDDDEEIGRPSRKNAKDNKSNRANKDKKHESTTKDHDDFDLELNKNEVVGVDYQPSTDPLNKLNSSTKIEGKNEDVTETSKDDNVDAVGGNMDLGAASTTADINDNNLNNNHDNDNVAEKVVDNTDTDVNVNEEKLDNESNGNQETCGNDNDASNAADGDQIKNMDNDEGKVNGHENETINDSQ